MARIFRMHDREKNKVHSYVDIGSFEISGEEMTTEDEDDDEEMEEEEVI